MRIDNNPAFNLIKTNTEWLAEQNDRVYSLNLKKFREEKKKINATVKQIETLYKLSNELEVESLPGDEDRFATDQDKLTRYKAWKKSLRNDIYLNETINAVNDMIYQQNLAMKQGVDSKLENIKPGN
jgi:carboxyl-terminal processing protease